MIVGLIALITIAGALSLPWCRGPRRILAAYVLTALGLAAVLLGRGYEQAGLFYLVFVLGGLPLILALGAPARPVAAPALKLSWRQRLAVAARLALPLMMVLLVAALLIIMRVVEPAQLSAAVVSLSALIVKQGHGQKVVGLFLLFFSLVYNLSLWRERKAEGDDHGP